MSRSLSWPAAALLALTLAVQAPAQFAIPRDQPDLPIDAKTRGEVIDKVLQELKDAYVFPDVAEKMDTAVRERVKKGDYDDVKTGQELAKRLTAHLQDVSHDKHLRVNCSTAKLPTPPARDSQPDPEEEAQFKERLRKTNGQVRRVERLGGNIGYLAVDAFPPPEGMGEPVAAAMSFLANTESLILDLRHNGGGSPHGVALLCSYFFDTQPVHLNSLYWRKGDRTDDFFTLKELKGPRYLGKDVYVLTSGRTFSGAEECAYNLQTQKRATIVGETTGGGAHPGGGARIGDHFIMFVPTGRAINPITKTNWEGVGVKPDVACAADKALDTAHQMAVKKLLETVKSDEIRKQIEADVQRYREREGKKD